jgi:hypothetical protein
MGWVSDSSFEGCREGWREEVGKWPGEERCGACAVPIVPRMGHPSDEECEPRHARPTSVDSHRTHRALRRGRALQTWTAESRPVRAQGARSRSDVPMMQVNAAGGKLAPAVLIVLYVSIRAGRAVSNGTQTGSRARPRHASARAPHSPERRLAAAEPGKPAYRPLLGPCKAPAKRHPGAEGAGRPCYN